MLPQVGLVNQHWADTIVWPIDRDSEDVEALRVVSAENLY